MKTYLLDTFNRFKKYSDKLDAQTVLCNKCWWVFNDVDEKETYIFKEDGTIIISISGAVTYGKWEYLPVNHSIVISGNNQSFMVIPSFWDECILALQVDGTNNFAFLIDEVNKSNFAPKSYTDVIDYFEAKERKSIEAKEEAEKRVLEDMLRKKEEDIKNKAEDVIEWFFITFVSVCAFVIICVVSFISLFIAQHVLQHYELLVSEGGIIVCSFLLLIALSIILYRKTKVWYIKRYIRKHPNNSETSYLEKML